MFNVKTISLQYILLKKKWLLYLWFNCVHVNHVVDVGKSKFLYSIVSNPQDCSKRFKLLPDRPVQSNTISASIELYEKPSATQQLIREGYLYTNIHHCL